MSDIFSIGNEIHQNSHWLGEELLKLADESLIAYEEKNFLLTVSRASSLLEGLLEKLFQNLKIEPPMPLALGSSIGCLRKSNAMPSELLERMDDANRIRIRAVHKKSSLSIITGGDALQIVNILYLVITWIGEEIIEKTDGNYSTQLLPIFLSVGGPHRLDQQQFLQKIKTLMRSIKVCIKSLSQGEYSDDKPFDQICDIMKSCKGVLIIGIERSHAYTVFEREASEKEKLDKDRFIPTAWNQIEGAIACALKLPILILRQQNIHKEGVFEAENHRHVIKDFDLKTDAKGLSQELEGVITGWVKDIRKKRQYKERK